MTAMIYLVAGKVAAGKSTLIASLAQAENTVLIAEDQWLAALFSDQMKTVPDYGRCAARLRAAMAPHVVALLRSGTSVALDFPANTRTTRAWMFDIIQQSGSAHELHFLDVPDDICKARLKRRNVAGSHVFSATEAQFDQITKHFYPPLASEGFNVILHREQLAAPKASIITKP